MIDWNKRKEEINNGVIHWLKVGCDEDEYDFGQLIITQEQAMISKLEADKVELLEALKKLSGCNEDCPLDCGMDCDQYEYYELIQKIEESK